MPPLSNGCLWEVPLRDPKLLPRPRRDRQRVPLVDRGGIGVEDELILLPELLGDLRVDLRQLALTPDDGIRRAGVARDSSQPPRLDVPDAEAHQPGQDLVLDDRID